MHYFSQNTTLSANIHTNICMYTHTVAIEMNCEKGGLIWWQREAPVS